MKKIVLLLLGFLVLTGSKPGLAQDSQIPRAEPNVEETVTLPKSEVAIEPQAADQKIERRLLDILQATGWFVKPKVAVREGVVFLDGETREDAHRKWAGDLARSTQDVVAVVNRVEIRREVVWNFEAVKKQFILLYWKVARSVPLVLLGASILFLSGFAAWFVAKVSRHLLAPRIPSPLLLTFVARAIAIPVVVLGLYFVLHLSNLTRLALTVLGGTGIIGLVLGFAFRDIAENFLASLFLSLRNPFRTGDYITVDGSEGIVQNLNTRSTVLLTLDGNHIQIPNAIVFKSKITNFSSNPYRRSEFAIGIGFEDSIQEAQDVILGVLKEHRAVIQEPEPLVLVDEIASATVNLKILYWFDSTIYSPNKIRSSLLRLAKRALLEYGISMPADAREIVFPNGVPIIQEPQKVLAGDTQTEKTKAAAPKPTEVKDSATEAEGSLTSDEDDIKVSTAGPAGPEVDENLLQDSKPG